METIWTKLPTPHAEIEPVSETRARNGIFQKVIRAKVGVLELAKQLGNVSQACKMMGYSRDSFQPDSRVAALMFTLGTQFGLAH